MSVNATDVLDARPIVVVSQSMSFLRRARPERLYPDSPCFHVLASRFTDLCTFLGLAAPITLSNSFASQIPTCNGLAAIANI